LQLPSGRLLPLLQVQAPQQVNLLWLVTLFMNSVSLCDSSGAGTGMIDSLTATHYAHCEKSSKPEVSMHHLQQ
jgi:hypothetical protein